jgi:hypothetical protein
VALAGGGGIALWQARQHTAAAPADAAIVVAMQSIDAAPPPPPPPSDAMAPPVDAAVLDAPRAHHVHTPPPPPPPPDTPSGTGYLQIVGEANIGARVVLDGKDIGHAPDKLVVPRGKHQVTIVRTDGTRLPAQSIDVTEYATIAHPVQPSF